VNVTSSLKCKGKDNLLEFYSTACKNNGYHGGPDEDQSCLVETRDELDRQCETNDACTVRE